MDCPRRSAPAGLPYDAMVEILARLPARSVYRFKCVAKAWRDLIDDPLNRKKLPQTLEGFFFADKPSNVDWTVEDFDFINLLPRSVPLDIDPRFSLLTTGRPEIEDLVFADSCNGLFLFQHVRMSDSFDMLGYIVCNPATKQWETAHLQLLSTTNRLFRLVYLFGFRSSCLLSFSLDSLPVWGLL